MPDPALEFKIYKRGFCCFVGQPLGREKGFEHVQEVLSGHLQYGGV